MKKKSIAPVSLFNRQSSIVNRKWIILLLFLLPLTSCGRYKARKELSKTQLFAEILKREDRHWIGNDKFFENNLLSSPFPEASKWCAIALGRIGNPRALPLLYRAMHSSDSAARAAAAFALGEIEDRERLKDRYLATDPQAITELYRLLDDPSISVRMRAVEALGKAGSHAEAAEIVHRLEPFSYQLSPYERAYVGISVAALARLNDPVGVPILERFAGSDDLGIRWRALDALTRMRSKSSSPLFARNLQNPNPEVQSYAACGMGVVADDREADLLFPLLPPRRGKSGEIIPLSVRICALQSLGAMKNPAAIPPIKAAISAEPGDKEHPDQLNFLNQAAVALGNIGTGDCEPVLLSLLKFPGPIADNALVALAKTLKENPERFYTPMETYRSNGQISGSAWAQAMAELGGPKAAEELRQMLERAAASGVASERQTLPDILSAMAKIDVPESPEIWNLLLRLRDCAVLPSAAAAYRPRPGTNAPWTHFIEAFMACNSSGNLQARIDLLLSLRPWIQEKEVQQLLLTGLKDQQRDVRDVSRTLLRGAGVKDINEDAGPGSGAMTEAIAEALAATRKNSTIAQLETSRGTLEIELFREDAPVTVQSFVLAAKRGTYDGMKLARMFPFRIEGKIPPTKYIQGRTINTEMNMRPFERGSIGMALAGENSDSGGFFITLAPQPDLDGVNTCFGRLVSGLQIADRIVPGDRILKIHIKETVSFQDYQRY